MTERASEELTKSLQSLLDRFHAGDENALNLLIEAERGHLQKHVENRLKKNSRDCLSRKRTTITLSMKFFKLR